MEELRVKGFLRQRAAAKEGGPRLINTYTYCTQNEGYLRGVYRTYIGLYGFPRIRGTI